MRVSSGMVVPQADGAAGGGWDVVRRTGIACVARRTAVAMLLTAASLGGQSPSPVLTGEEASAIVSTAANAFYRRSGSAAYRARQRTALARDPGNRAAMLALATLDYQTSLLDRADSLYQVLLRDTSSTDAIVTQALLGRSAVAGTRAQYDLADSISAQALQRARRLQDPYATSQALVRLALFRRRTQGVGPALTLLSEADSAARDLGPERRASIACTRAQMLNGASDTLAYKEAVRGLALIRGLPPSRLRTNCLFFVGQSFAREGALRADSARRYLRLAAAEQGELGDWVGQAASYQWIGNSLRLSGRFSAARHAYDSALTIGLRGNAASARAWAVFGLGLIRIDLGDEVAGVRLLSQASAILRQQNDVFGVQEVEVALMGLRLRRSDTLTVARMLPGTEAALRRLGDQLARQRMLNIGIGLARVRGDYPRARQLAEELWTQSRSDKRTIGVEYALIRGTAALEAGDLDAADSLLAVPETKLVPRLSSYVLLARSAEVAARRGDLVLAEKRLRDAHVALREFRQRAPDPEMQRSTFSSSLLDMVDPDLGVARVLNAMAIGGRTPAAFELAAERRARALTDAMVRASALNDGRISQGALQSRAAEGVTSEAEIRAVLRPSEALLFYVTGERNEPTTLFVVTRDRTSAITLPTSEALTPVVGELRRTIESGAAGVGLRSRLGTTLVAPALPLLPSGVTRLIVVGDGPIQEVPFDALQLPDGRAMLERFEISSLASPATLPLLRARPEWRGSRVLALAVNDPRRRSPVTGAPLPALQRATVEAQHAASRRPRGVALTGGSASEAALYARRDTVAALHIAAHVVVDPAIVTRSAIMLSSGGGEDGNVYPSELSQLGIAAGLVVLSGCRTAGAQVDGAEGLQGFTAPLLIGGTRTVIATRWNLADRAGSEMMRDFHEQLALGADAGSALHAAKQRQFSRGRPPATWAVFQLTGDPAYRLAGGR